MSLLSRSRHLFRAHHVQSLKGKSEPERLVILGSGWAGYRLMQEIDSEKYNVSMVSPRNHFLFTPLLASAAVGGSSLESVCEPIRPLAAAKNARFFEAKATKLDKEQQIVTCQTLDGLSFPLHYDKLVVSVGYQANDFGIPNLEENAFFMKETGDAQRLHDHILGCFEKASFMHMLDGDEALSPMEEKLVREQLSFVIVGAGPTGTELCGELSDFLHNEVKGQYPHLWQFCTVKLLDGAPKILGPFQNDALQTHAKQHLEQKMGVDVHLNEFCDRIEDNSIVMKSGNKYDFSTLVWCAGIKPLPIVSEMGLQMNKNKAQILTDARLKVKNDGVDNIYAIGDCATIEDNWLPQTAQVAAQQGEYLAETLNFDDTETPFKSVDKGTLAYIGGTHALYRSPKPFPNITGFLGYFTWRSAYWSMQLSNRNRIMLGLNWFMNYLFGRDLTRINSQSLPATGDKITQHLVNAVGTAPVFAGAMHSSARRLSSAAMHARSSSANTGAGEVTGAAKNVTDKISVVTAGGQVVEASNAVARESGDTVDAVQQEASTESEKYDDRGYDYM